MNRSIPLAAVLLVSGCSLVADPGSLARPPDPGVPTGVAATPGNGQVTVSWNPIAAGDVAGYRVLQGTDPSALAKVADVSASTSSWVATGLANGTTYYFAVASRDSAGTASSASDPATATPFLPDTTPAVATLLSPGNGAANVPLDATLIVTFSETMDPGTVTVTLTPSLVLGPPEWNANSTSVQFEPFWVNSLVAETNYAVEVSGDDLAGNPTSAAFHFQTVGIPPTLDATTPPFDATNVPTGTAIQLIFSEPMTQVDPTFVATPTIGCAGRWVWSNGGRTATCAPLPSMTASTHYSVTVSASDLSGTPMVVPIGFAFTTASAPDTTPPSVASSSPTASQSGVSRTASIAVTFSEAVDKPSAQAAFSIVSPGGFNGGSFSWSGDGRTMTYTAPSAFAYGATVQWRVNTAVKDLAGNYMAAQVDRTFYVIRSATATLYAVAGMDGWITYNPGSGTYSLTTADLVAGDGSSGQYYRAFLGFSLSTIPATATAITSATLYVYQSSVQGTPYTSLGSLLAQSVDYGTSLTTADFSTPTLTYLGRCKPAGVCTDQYTLATSFTSAWYTSVSVTGKVGRDLAARTTRGNRCQFRLRFATDADGDAVYDWVRLYAAESSANKPFLSVTYEYP
jgi:hypothetical protein